MKPRFAIWITLLMPLAFLFSCGAPADLRKFSLVLHTSCAKGPSQMDLLKKTMLNRFHLAFEGKGLLEIIPGKDALTLNAECDCNAEELRALLLPRGEIEIWETWAYKDLEYDLGAINMAVRKLENVTLGDSGSTGDVDILEDAMNEENKNARFAQENPFFALLLAPSAQTDPRSPLAGTCLVEDTARINKWLAAQEVKDSLSPGLHFLWSKNRRDDDTGRIDLIAVYCEAGTTPAMNGADIASASARLREDGGGSSTMGSISIKMNSAGKGKFATLSRNNAGSFLAFSLDSEVVYYPKVQSEISGGEAEISGRFSLGDAKILAAILSAGAYPCEVVLTNFK